MAKRTQTTAAKLEALSAELTKLAYVIDFDACQQNLYDMGIVEPAYDSDDSDKLAYAIEMRRMISASYGV